MKEDEKMKKEDLLTCHECMHKSHGNLLITVGIIAVVYAFINYLRTTVGVDWAPYTGWYVGGAILVIAGLAKGYWLRRCC